MDASSAVAAEFARSPKLKVFISYSRDDLKFADQLDIGLNLCGFEPILDRHGISGGEDWKKRLGSLIRDADTVVFVLSPSSAKSEICKWEVDEAYRLNKRILPVLAEDLGGASPPPLLRERNYIFFYDEPNVPGSGFGAGLAQLVAALQTDLAWIREHTRLLARATEWGLGARPTNRLLSGSDVVDAKDWAARRPKDAPPPTNLHLDFIKASEEQETARSSAQRQQLEMMAQAQEERAKALAAAEDALSREALAQSRRIKLRNASLIAITLFALVAGWGWFQAVAKRRVAQEKTTQAETQKRRAERQTAIARQEKAQAEKQTNLAADMVDVSTSLIVQLSRKKKLDDEDYPKVLTLFQKGAEQGNPTSMGNIGAMYEGGLGIEKSFPKAIGWYRKAAKLGNPRAMIYLGDIYLAGRHMPRDRDRAAKWYLNAALAAIPT